MKILWAFPICTTEKVFGKKLYISMKKLLPISQADASGRLTERKALCLLGSLHQSEYSPCTPIFHLTWDSHFESLISLRNIIQMGVTCVDVLLLACKAPFIQDNPSPIFFVYLFGWGFCFFAKYRFKDRKTWTYDTIYRLHTIGGTKSFILTNPLVWEAWTL